MKICIIKVFLKIGILYLLGKWVLLMIDYFKYKYRLDKLLMYNKNSIDVDKNKCKARQLLIIVFNNQHVLNLFIFPTSSLYLIYHITLCYIIRNIVSAYFQDKS